MNSNVTILDQWQHLDNFITTNLVFMHCPGYVWKAM